MSTLAEFTAEARPRNAWQLFQQLSRGRWTPGRAWENPRYRRKFMARSLATPFRTWQLLSALARQPQLESLLHAQPGLPCRLHRPWLTPAFSRRDALQAITFHYASLSSLLTPTRFAACMSRQSALLATLSGKNGELYSIYLGAVADLDKEGEATLLFRNEQNVTLAELTFTLCLYKGKKTIFIGGLQGAKAWVEHDLIQQATKACHGLFPKRLLLESVCQLAQKWDIEQCLAVGNSTHVYRSWRYEKKKKEKLHADYDSFWLSLGAQQENSGFFRLPGAIPRKPMEEIASKKRAEYRRRYELLDSLEAQLQN